MPLCGRRARRGPTAWPVRAASVAAITIPAGLAASASAPPMFTGVPGPGKAAEVRQPIVRWPTAGRRVSPKIPIPLAIRAGPAALEPRVPVGGVVRHEVEDHLEAEPTRLRKQRVEVVQRAEQRINAAAIRHVVAEVGHRRGADRRNPDRIDPKPGQVPEPAAPRIRRSCASRPAATRRSAPRRPATRRRPARCRPETPCRPGACPGSARAAGALSCRSS